MIKEIVMPKYGLQQDEGTVLRWLKEEGDSVDLGQALVEVETDKAVFEYESTETGILRKILVEEGTVVPVLSVIAVLSDTADEAIDSSPSTPEITTEVEQEFSLPKPAVSETKTGGRVRRSPAARKLAESLGVDLAAVNGTGPGGRIVKRDVEMAASQTQQKAQPVVEERPLAEGLAPLSKMRQAIGRGMALSKTTIPHFYLDIEVDMTDAELWRRELAASQQIKISATDLIVKSTAATLMDYPSLNARLEGTDAMFVHDTVNIGLAVGTDDELLVPVIADAQKKSLQSLAKERAGTVEAAQKGRLRGRARATITISNLGMFGVTSFIAIVNPPEAAALAIGGILPRVRPFGDSLTIAVRQVMQVTISVDHRLADGMRAAQFLKDFKEKLEDLDVLESWL